MRAPAPGPTAAETAGRYQAVRAATVKLCAPLSPEDCTVQSMDDASPAKWHLAHTTWFFETFILEREVPGYQPFHPAYRVLFNSYYETVGRQHPRPRRGLVSRPGLEEIHAYRRHVDGTVLDWLAGRGAEPGAAGDVLELGLQHEQQHQELILTDIKHMLSSNCQLHPAYRLGPPDTAAADPGPLRWLPVAGGIHPLGHHGRGFSFDNERPRHDVLLAPFSLASRPVTCGEYLEFMADGGYSRPELWLADGWAQVQGRGWRAPLYWEKGDRGWSLFTLGGLRPVREAEPVAHVSYYEADAFARWAGARLPAEAEWEVAAAGEPMAGNFAESEHLHPEPGPAGGSGPAQLFGDIWEWTASAYAPYPGYRPLAGALGEYNGKFMVSQMVLRGGSCASPRSHLRATYRNFFYPHMRWQFSGIRLARDAEAG